jgi:FKBP-type peptidyl-prolyl cis-trans isomerase SlyD
MTEQIGPDRVVSIVFELHNSEGDLLDSSAESGPLSYLHGHSEILPGLEQALDSQQVGHEARIEVTPENGFGARDEQLIFDVPRAQLDFEPEAGQVLQAQGPGGVSAPFRVIKVGAEKVTLDGNHPMAGMHLVFTVKVVAVRDATPEELRQGRSQQSN